MRDLDRFCGHTIGEGSTVAEVRLRAKSTSNSPGRLALMHPFADASLLHSPFASEPPLAMLRDGLGFCVWIHHSF